MNRNIENLLDWKKNLELKKERNIEEIFNIDARPKINQQSEIILSMRNPDYLDKRVEERLLDSHNRYI